MARSRLPALPSRRLPALPPRFVLAFVLGLVAATGLVVAGPASAHAAQTAEAEIPPGTTTWAHLGTVLRVTLSPGRR
ncbi:hypothetical protein WKI68_40680 [Streptomyces sp. MS1.HAVA.3]|uniref:Uncharacterized protein n=1 Tax=Streptomyces caledonius TaxID=3134107 RepID=A0ABU8UDW7_9ACTN